MATVKGRKFPKENKHLPYRIRKNKKTKTADFK